MTKIYHAEKVFEKVDFSIQTLDKGDYEACTFIACNFSSSDLSHINFTECRFEECNLSTAKITQTAFKDVAFQQYKMLGLRFDQCNHFLFSASFDKCTLNLSSFYKLKMHKTKFEHTQIQEVDFTEADLTLSAFSNCDLDRTHFEKTILDKVDFRSAYNYRIDPELNRLKKARFSNTGIIGLLSKYDIEVSD